MTFLSKSRLKTLTTKLMPSVSVIVRQYSCGKDLKSVLASKITTEIECVKAFRKQHDNTTVGDIKVGMVYGGMRNMLGLICDTSELDPEEGIRFRGLSIPECQKCLPKIPCGTQPLPEGVFWLLMTGDVPTEEQAKSLSEEWAARSCVSEHVMTLLKNLPKDVHPMSQLSAALTVMNRDSKFVKAYNDKVPKAKYWETVYEDSMDVIAQLPVIAAQIYRNVFKSGCSDMPAVDSSKDWSYNFCNMLGYPDEKFIELMRLYLTIHCDHGGGNVSAHTVHLVGSALSDPYLSLAAGINGLAGPLHGLANQEVLTWILEIQKEFGDKVTEEQLKGFIEKTLKTSVVPGYGHAVLRKTDPRYLCQREFAQKHLANDPLFKIVSLVYKVAPPLLTSLGKVKNPWPNVDAHSGVILQYYGLKEMNFYTVLFGVSRALGVLAYLIWDRALGLSIERPKSISTKSLMKQLNKC